MDKPKFNNAKELSDYIMAGNSNLKYSLHDRVEKLEEFVYSLQDQLINVMQHVQDLEVSISHELAKMIGEK